MNYDFAGGIAPDASVRHFLSPIAGFFTENGVTEIAVNEPGYIWVQNRSVWREIEVPEMSAQNTLNFAIASAEYTHQALTGESPILSATLPQGERIQIVIPPAVEDNRTSLTIRVPSYVDFSMDSYEKGGMFDRIRPAESRISEVDEELLALLKDKKYRKFFELAVAAGKNIGIVGDTGSGKTQFMKTLCQLISSYERLITIEDARELHLRNHRNKVHLLYSTQGKASQRVDPATLIKSCMRMKPDRVLPAELRGGEAFDFVNLLTSGHKGSITSWHAESPDISFERFSLMCKMNSMAASYTHSELMRLLHMTIDIVAHIGRDDDARFFTGIYFDPHKKMKINSGH